MRTISKRNGFKVTEDVKPDLGVNINDPYVGKSTEHKIKGQIQYGNLSPEYSSAGQYEQEIAELLDLLNNEANVYPKVNSIEEVKLYVNTYINTLDWNQYSYALTTNIDGVDTGISYTPQNTEYGASEPFDIQKCSASGNAIFEYNISWDLLNYLSGKINVYSYQPGD